MPWPCSHRPGGVLRPPPRCHPLLQSQLHRPPGPTALSSFVPDSVGATAVSLRKEETGKHGGSGEDGPELPQRSRDPREPHARVADESHRTHPKECPTGRSEAQTSARERRLPQGWVLPQGAPSVPPFLPLSRSMLTLLWTRPWADRGTSSDPRSPQSRGKQRQELPVAKQQGCAQKPWGWGHPGGRDLPS